MGDRMRVTIQRLLGPFLPKVGIGKYSSMDLGNLARITINVPKQIESNLNLWNNR